MLGDVDVLPMIHVAAREEESEFPCTANSRRARMQKSLDEDDDQLTDAAAVHDTCSFAPDRVGQTSRHAFSTVMNAIYVCTCFYRQSENDDDNDDDDERAPAGFTLANRPLTKRFTLSPAVDHVRLPDN